MYLSLEKRTIRLGLFCYKTENSIFHIVNIVVVSLRPLHTVQPTLPVPTTLSLLKMAKRVPVLPLGINLFQFLHCFNIRRKMLSFPPSRWSLYKTYTMRWNHVSNSILISCTRFFTRFLFNLYTIPKFRCQIDATRRRWRWILNQLLVTSFSFSCWKLIQNSALSKYSQTWQ